MQTPRSLLAAPLLLGLTACHGAVEHGTVDRRLDAPAGALWVRGTNTSGETCVLAGDDDTIAIHADVRVRAFDPATARRGLRAFAETPSFLMQDGTLDLRSPDGAALCEGPCDVVVDWEIRVPARTAATLEAGSGRTCASGLAGDVSLRTSSGEVAATGLTGALTVRTTSGDVSLHGVADVDVVTTSGALHLDGARGTVGVTTGSGDVTIEDARADVHVESTSGAVTVDSALARDATWALTTTSGDVATRLPEGQGFRVEFRTSSGTLFSDFDLGLPSFVGGGTVGTPTGVIRATTASGNLRLTRAAR